MESKFLGAIYILAQVLGGLLAGLWGIMLLDE